MDEETTLEITHTVTRVGVDNIQFYVPSRLSRHPRFVFDAEDEFCARTLPDAGLLLTRTDDDGEVVLADVLDALDVEYDDQIDPHEVTL